MRGVSPQVIDGSLESPYVWEYATGVNRQFGSRAAVRADFVYRDYGGFYVQRIDATTGRGGRYTLVRTGERARPRLRPDVASKTTTMDC